MKIAIFGLGYIGVERIKAIQYINSNFNQNIEILGFEPNIEQVKNIKSKYNINIYDDLNSIFEQRPDWIFICTPHDMVLNIIKQAFDKNINVLVEKPLGRNLNECNDILKYKSNKSKLYIGFNYRFFDGVESLLKDCKDEKFGKLISVNMILGHGNSPGMEKSWKLDPVKCGGGCLIDPGVHLLDLILNISKGTLSVDSVNTWNGFWNTGIEEEAHILMHDENNTIFNTQISLNKWKSSFKLEVNGTEGYGIVEGRGRSYGPQSYRTGVRWGWQQGKSQQETEILVVNQSNCENSFIKETISVLGIQNTFTLLPCNDIEAKKVMQLLEICRQ